jgi:hypothetical protein
MDDSQALTLELWLANLKVNSIHLECNEGHAPNYMTAADWITTEMHSEKDSEFHDCDPEDLKRRCDTGTIWSLQIYPDTPIGFYRWVAPTMLEVIAKARAAWPEIEKGRYPQSSERGAP